MGPMAVLGVSDEGYFSLRNYYYNFFYYLFIFVLPVPFYVHDDLRPWETLNELSKKSLSSFLSAYPFLSSSISSTM